MFSPFPRLWRHPCHWVCEKWTYTLRGKIFSYQGLLIPESSLTQGVSVHRCWFSELQAFSTFPRIWLHHHDSFILCSILCFFLQLHTFSFLPATPSRLSHLTSHLPIKLWETPSIWKGIRHLSGNYSKVHISPCQYRKWLCVKVLFLGVERINCIWQLLMRLQQVGMLKFAVWENIL